MQADESRRAQDRNSTRYVLAIDLGSGGFKAAVVSDSGEIAAGTEVKTTTHLLPNGGAEQDPAEWWEGVKKAAKQVVRESKVAPEDIVAIGCDSQWSVVVAVDENGEPLMRAVHWMDTRGGPYNCIITAGFPSIQGYGLLKLIKWVKLTGLVPTRSGMDSLGHVLFIKHERPDIYSKTYKFLEPMDFLTARLTGKFTATQKSMVPFVVVDNREWGSLEYSAALLNLAGLDKNKFPTLIPNDGIVGPILPEVAEELGLHPATPVVAGLSDSNASAIGAGAVQDFETIIYIGTSLYMTCHVPFKKTDLAHFMTSLPSPFKSRYYLLGEQGTGGKCVEFYLKNIVYPDDELKSGPMPDDAYVRFNKSASEAPTGSGGVIFLPWLNGSIVPCEDPHVRGAFINLSLSTTRRHLSRAVMEGLAYNSRWTRLAAEKFIGRRIESFRFAGGGALSDLWAQIHADVLGVSIHQLDDPINTTVRGTAFLAFVVLGYRSLSDISKLVKIKTVYEPDESNCAVYDHMYAQYRELFKKNRKIFKALNS
ncbi:MAG: FGGY-family carbohydrate kinase [Desulfobacterales bacterium]|nr:MAG: FGGY-family carbohydrate kinase [Desulfobacterales bacterium]